MPGSRSQASIALLYDHAADTATWEIRSVAERIMQAIPYKEIILVGDDNYEAVSKLAGPMPALYVEEVSTQPKQEDKDEAQNEGSEDK